MGMAGMGMAGMMGTNGGPDPRFPACTSGPLFDTLPLPLDGFIGFRALGFLAPPIHVFPAKHSSFARSLPGDMPAPATVRSPGHAWLTTVEESTFPAGNKAYTLYFYACRDVRVFFNHIGAVSSRVAAEMSNLQPTCFDVDTGAGSGLVRKCDYAMQLELQGGDDVGQSDMAAGVDFGMVDFRQPPAAFAEPTHYNRDWLYFASPVPLFTPETRAALEPRVGAYDGSLRRTADPIWGTYVQDLPGTAQGNWFVPGKTLTNTTEVSSFVALVHDYVDPSQPVLSNGTSIPGLGMGLYTFPLETTGVVNRDFADVRPGATYCYERFSQGRTRGASPLTTPAGVVLVAMPDASTLRLEHVAATTCAAAPALSAAATTFVR